MGHPRSEIHFISSPAMKSNVNRIFFMVDWAMVLSYVWYSICRLNITIFAVCCGVHWGFHKATIRRYYKKDVLKICSKFIGEHPSQSVISIKFLCNFIEIALRHGCSPVYLVDIFRTLFSKNISGRLLLFILTNGVKSSLSHYVSCISQYNFFILWWIY